MHTLLSNISRRAICHPVDDLYEWEEAEPEAQSHESPKLKLLLFISFLVGQLCSQELTCEMNPMVVILISLIDDESSVKI